MSSLYLLRRLATSWTHIRIFLVCWGVLASSLVSADTEVDTDAGARVDLTWGLKIPMRDGVKLNATVYRPAGVTEPLPVIFSLTPYVGDSNHVDAMHLARRGYIFVVADVRGRGNSEGEFLHPFFDAKDGHDAIEWLAKQAWCNGKLAMFGGSYLGTNQWATAKETPPHLTAIHPVAPGYMGRDYPALNNIFRAYNMQWDAFVSGVTSNNQLFMDNEFWTRRYHELYQGKVSFRSFDQWVGIPSKAYQRWLTHPSNDEYWDEFTPTEQQYAKLDIPILTVTGIYDDDQPGAMEYYRRHMQFGSSEGKRKHYLDRPS